MVLIVVLELKQDNTGKLLSHPEHAICLSPAQI